MKRTILMLSLMLATTMSFAQEIQKGEDKNGKLRLEKKGKKIVNENFDKITTYNSEANLIGAKLNGLWGFYDNDGKLVIPHQYPGLVCNDMSNLDRWFIKGQMQVDKNDGKRISIDKTGKESEYEVVIETTYDGAGYFFKKGDKWAFADKDKKVLTEFKYDVIRGPIGVNPFVYKATRDGQDFRLDAKGQEEAAIESETNTDSKKTDAKTNEKHKWTCGGCGGTEITDGSNKRPSTNKTHCSNPKTKNSTSHSWDYTGKVK